MSKLVLVRHGQSVWNLENRFTGWVDVDLSEQGVKEAIASGQKLKAENYSFDIAYSSVLLRANRTLEIILKELDQSDILVCKDQALNERHYGDLQGKNKAQTAQEFGDEQVKIWRRSYDTPPPNGESLKDTAARTLPYFEREILPKVTDQNKNIIVAAHGNSLRSIIMKLDSLSPEEVIKLEIPTGLPIVYEYNDSQLKKLGYLQN